MSNLLVVARGRGFLKNPSPDIFLLSGRGWKNVNGTLKYDVKRLQENEELFETLP